MEFLTIFFNWIINNIVQKSLANKLISSILAQKILIFYYFIKMKLLIKYIFRLEYRR